MDRLGDILNDLRDGYLTSNQAQIKLDFLQFEEERDQQRKQEVRKREWETYCLDDYTRYYGSSPEDILVDQERVTEIANFLREIWYKLKESQRVVLYLSVIEGRTQHDIGKMLGVSQQRVSMIFKQIQDKAGICDDIKECLYTNQTGYHNNHLTEMGFPFEIAMRTNIGGKFHVRNGRSRYVSKTECRLPQYFEECFHDKNTVCPLCDVS